MKIKKRKNTNFEDGDDYCLSSNNIYVIDEGKVVDSGKHNELMEKSKLYKSFYEKQFQK